MENIAAGVTTTLRHLPPDSDALRERLEAKRREAIMIAAAVAFTQQNGAAGDFDTYVLSSTRSVNARSARKAKVRA
jgi:hypothetical protein